MPRRPVPAALFAALITAILAGAACAPEPGDEAESAPAEQTLPAEQEAFWASLQSLCGQAFEGEVLEAPEGDAMAGQRLVMHVRECGPSEIRIPFHVGEDRSRTWVLTRTDDGLRLKHDHRHEDGAEDEVTQYGGDTAGPGSRTSQEFPADGYTRSLIPAAATNVWTVEVDEDRFVYALRREGTDRRYRIAFDLTRPVEAPPPPWGAS